jgi:protein SCO1
MSKKKLFYLVFFVALVAIFYFTLTQVIPGFTKKKFPPISYVRPFRFTDQDGNFFTEKNVAGKVYVAEYFYTTCKTVCPIMNDNMKLVYEKLREDKDFMILSHTSMPEIDTPARLKYFADSLRINTAQWVFLTGAKDSLYNTARLSYTLDDPSNNVKSIDDQFIHTQFWALVDRNGDVRKIYDGLKTSEVENLVRDAKRLLKEKPTTL